MILGSVYETQVCNRLVTNDKGPAPIYLSQMGQGPLSEDYQGTIEIPHVWLPLLNG